MKTKEHKIYRSIYQLELAEDLTGRKGKTIKQRMKRNNWTLADTIKAYLSHSYSVA